MAFNCPYPKFSPMSHARAQAHAVICDEYEIYLSTYPVLAFPQLVETVKMGENNIEYD